MSGDAAETMSTRYLPETPHPAVGLSMTAPMLGVRTLVPCESTYPPTSSPARTTSDEPALDGGASASGPAGGVCAVAGGPASAPVLGVGSVAGGCAVGGAPASSSASARADDVTIASAIRI